MAPETLPLERSWDFREWGLDDAAFERLHHLAVVERHILRDMPQIEGCSDALWRLSDAGVWIRIITHRLYVNWSHATAIADTVTWLDQNRVPYRDLCFLGAKPQVEADLYIDDGPHNIEALDAQGNETIIFDQPYNRHVEGRRATTWAEVTEIVLEMAADSTGSVEVTLPGFDAGAERLDHRLGSTTDPSDPSEA